MDLPDTTADASLDRVFMHQRTLFGTSATMVGVCLTAISLLLVVERLSQVRTVSRIALGIDSLVFLAAAIYSFGAMRALAQGHLSPLAKRADALMLIGLVGTVVVCLTLVFSLF
jgi:hypothetical protein